MKGKVAITLLVAIGVASTVTAVASGQGATVTANGSNTFSVSTPTLAVGQAVSFSNAGGEHNVHFVGEGAGTPNPANTTAWTFQRAFATPGPYTFYCDIHGSPAGGMQATLNVVAATPSPTPTPTPTPAPTPAPPTPTTPGTDSTAPKATRVTASGTLRRAVLKLRLDEAATVTARLTRSGQRRTLKRVTRKLAAGSRQITLTRTLSSGRRYRIALRIVDGAGNVATRAVSFTARR